MKRNPYLFLSLLSILLTAALCSSVWQVRATTGPAPDGADSTIVFTAQLLPANEVPPVTSADANAFGNATMTLNVTRDSGGNITAATAKTDFSVSNFRNAESIIAAHIHDGLAGQNGPVIADSGISTSAPLPLTGGATAFSKAGLTLPTPIAQDLI